MAQTLEKQKRRMVIKRKKMMMFALLVDKSILSPYRLLHLVLTRNLRQLPHVVLAHTAMVQVREMMKLFMPQTIQERTIPLIVRNVVRLDQHILMFIIHVKPALEKVMLNSAFMNTDKRRDKYYFLYSACY